MQVYSAWNNQWVRRAAKAAATVVVLWVLAWAILPGVIKNQLETLGSEQLGRKVTVGSVSLRPWSLELTLGELAMAQADGTGQQVRIKRIYIDAELQSLLRFAPVVDALEVDGVVATLTHLGAGRYDVDDILERLAAASRPEDASKPLPRFAFYNLALRDVSLDFVDRTINKTHEVRGLAFSIPFLSNLPSLREVSTEPRLAFRLNGSHFDSAAQTTPFAASRKTDAAIHLKDLDVAPYLSYWPRSLPVLMQAGVVGLDLRLAFEQTKGASVKLSGSVELQKIRVADASAQNLLTVDALRVELDDVRPLEQVIKLGGVELTRPTLALLRDKAGRINVLNLGGAPPVGAKAKAAALDGKAVTEPQTSSNPWKVDVAQLAVRTGKIRWADQSTAPAALLDVNDLTLDASGLTWPVTRPVQLAGSFALDAPKADQRTAGRAPAEFASRLSFSGSATDRTASVMAELDGLPLALASPYLSQVLQPVLDGRLSGRLGVKWATPALQLEAPTLSLSDLRLVDQRGVAGKNSPLQVKNIAVSGAQVDLAKQSVILEKLVITQPSVQFSRTENKRWMFEDWRQPVGGTVPDKAAETGKPKPVSNPWRVAVNDFSLEAGAVQYADRAMGRRVALDVTALSVQLKNFSTDSKKPGAFKLSAQVKIRRGEAGQLNFAGALGMKPLAVQGQVQATHLPAHALAPYFTDVFNVRLLRADAGFKGAVSYVAGAAGPLLKLSGDVLVEDLQANSLPQDDDAEALLAGRELLSWQALNLRGLDVDVVPGRATTVVVGETALTDFYARVIISEKGRINLQDVMKPSVVSSDMAQAGAATASPVPVIRMGPTSLSNGRILFSDHFIKPNYTANLTELNGSLGAFTSLPANAGTGAEVPAMADLVLRGRAEESASLEILGKLNPLAHPLELEIKGKMRDMELPPLSPYSVKYVGHGIERGKLSMDVAYRVQPDGQLVASNQVILNQLVFGEPVKGAPNSLPVRLAVALLADRHGVIDVNLPISGSINDPEFRIGSLIFKMFMNLIAKAVTSPFSLLSAAFGGGDGELGQVSFAPGSVQLSAEAQTSLNKVAGAMKERPGLILTVIGEASLETEREAFRQERLQALMLAEKRRAAVAGGGRVADMNTVSAAEKPALLKEVYKRAQIPKQRNLLGMAKSLPDAEMEAVLLSQMTVTEEHMRDLARARGMVVKDYLARSELSQDRLFLGATRLVAADAKWLPRAELNLALK